MACRTFSVVTAAAASLGWWRETSVAIGTDGLPVIRYGLWLLHCPNAACTGSPF